MPDNEETKENSYKLVISQLALKAGDKELWDIVKDHKSNEFITSALLNVLYIRQRKKFFKSKLSLELAERDKNNYTEKTIKLLPYYKKEQLTA